MIRTIEELSLNAWPSPQTCLYDGWILRFGQGYTKRANSVNPLYRSGLDPDEKIKFCEQVYQEQRLDVVFKLSPGSHPEDLDEILSARGYRKDSPTSVQVLDLASAEIHPPKGMVFGEDLSAGWLDAFHSMTALDERYWDALQRILLNILPRHCFVSLREGARTLAVGLGVLQAGFIGLFDIVVDEAFRNRGFGAQIVESILYWGKQNGAQKAYLQVMLDNPPALHLYSKIGFVEEYQYWYRIKPG